MTADFPATFEQLKGLFQPYAPALALDKDLPGDYSLNTPFTAQYQKALFFGAVQIKKNYVSFHLMPVYMFPDLLETLSPELRRHMQGKSCFNFKQPEPALLAELAELTRRSFERLQAEKLLAAEFLQGVVMSEPVHNTEEMRFEISQEGYLAVLTYELQPQRIIFNHTGVPSELEGRGLGSKLVKAGLEYARSQDLKVTPLCSFVAGYIERHPEYQGLLD